jgi:tRNA G18 (ribose-2'-O)-methylase SpoU
MLHIHPVECYDDFGLLPYRADRRPTAVRPQPGDEFMAGGEKVVQRLAASRWEVVSLLLSRAWLDRLRPVLETRPEPHIDIYVTEKKHVEAITGYSCYQPVKAIGRIPGPVSMEEILTRGRSPRLLAGVDALSSAENLGVVVRNCAAFGVDALLVGETAASPFLERAIRSSMGAIFRLPVVQTERLAGTLKGLQRRGIRCVAAHPGGKQRRLDQVGLAGDSCLVFGSEGHGLRAEVVAVCDEAGTVPMAGGVDSLNVGSAAAVCLYEAVRQRGFAGLTGVKA